MDSWSNIKVFAQNNVNFELLRQNDAESFKKFIKNSVWDPKRAKFVQKSYGKFTESLRNLPRPVQEDP